MLALPKLQVHYTLLQWQPLQINCPVRYLIQNWHQSNLLNNSYLPLVPFRNIVIQWLMGEIQCYTSWKGSDVLEGIPLLTMVPYRFCIRIRLSKYIFLRSSQKTNLPTNWVLNVYKGLFMFVHLLFHPCTFTWNPTDAFLIPLYLDIAGSCSIYE